MKRKKIKTILCHMAIITICMGVFCHGFIMGDSLSLDDRLFCYAETDSWSDCDNSDLVTAFRYYCKSRNLAIDGSLADALTSVTTNIFNNLCNTVGVDPTQLQAELKKTTEGNQGLRFLFTQTGINAYNRIFAAFLQNNDLSVGDSVDNKLLDSQNVFVDDDGNSCIPYVVNRSSNSSNSEAPNSQFISAGTYYKYSHSDVYTGLVCSFNINNRTYTQKVVSGTGSGPYWGALGHYFAFVDGGDYAFIGDGISVGDICIIFNQKTNHYMLGSIGIRGNFPASNYYHNNFGLYVISDITSILNDDNVQQSDIYITTNNNTINNNSYNNNYTIIYNDGDYYEDDEEPLPSQPGGGGNDPGGGDDSDDWEPSTPTIPEPGTPGFPIVDLPDIDIPDIPSLDLSLGDLREKFPFSLPFDIIAVLSVLDGEPQAPHIQAAVPIGRWYTWEMDFDFSEFDNYARIFRIFEFIGFCIGLAVFTVHFVKG